MSVGWFTDHNVRELDTGVLARTTWTVPFRAEELNWGDGASPPPSWMSPVAHPFNPTWDRWVDR